MTSEEALATIAAEVAAASGASCIVVRAWRAGHRQSTRRDDADWRGAKRIRRPEWRAIFWPFRRVLG